MTTQYRIRNGLLITENGIEEKDLLLKDGRIETLIPRDWAVSSDYLPLDCAGCYVSPGFVDIHQHGGGGSDYMDEDADTYLNATEAHLAHGTTSVMPTLLSADTDALVRSVKRYCQAEQSGKLRANLLGIHVEGPYISPRQAGAQKPEHIRAFDEREYRAVYEASQGRIKRWSVAPEVEGAQAFADFARENGIALSIAHSDADFDTVCRAYDWGYRHVTHLYSCTSTIIRRGGFRVAGVLEAAYFLDGMNVEIIADGCHLPTTLLSYVAKFKSADRIALITDAMRAAGQEVTESFLGSAADPLPVVIEDGVAKMTDRTAFAGSIATADRLLKNMLTAGVSLPDAVKMLTVTPLRQMGLSVKKGLIHPGYEADICIFDADVRVHTVICNGVKVI